MGLEIARPINPRVCQYHGPVDQADIDRLVEAERQARADIKAAEDARTEAADRRALAIHELANAVGPAQAAKHFGLAVSALQKPRDRAKFLLATRAGAR